MVEEGQEVSSGAPLMILEAMKMRNEVVTGVSGTVSKVCVKEGEMVPKNHLLVEFR
jgi:biotin carboxyl carrier protein